MPGDRPMLKMTHTVAELEVSARTYDEIEALLRCAGYDHTFGPDGMIDMTGIGLSRGSGSADYFKAEEGLQPVGLSSALAHTAGQTVLVDEHMRPIGEAAAKITRSLEAAAYPWSGWTRTPDGLGEFRSRCTPSGGTETEGRMVADHSIKLVDAGPPPAMVEAFPGTGRREAVPLSIADDGRDDWSAWIAQADGHTEGRAKMTPQGGCEFELRNVSDQPAIVTRSDDRSTAVGAAPTPAGTIDTWPGIFDRPDAEQLWSDWQRSPDGSCESRRRGTEVQIRPLLDIDWAGLIKIREMSVKPAPSRRAHIEALGLGIAILVVVGILYVSGWLVWPGFIQLMGR